MILGICENTDVLKVMNIVVTILKIIQIVVPIVLMFSLMFKMIGAMTKHDDDAIASLKKKAVPNIVAAVLIFIVPLLVGIIMNVTFPDSEYTKCIVGISSEKLQQAYEDKAKRLVNKAENTLNINDYVNAMNYMPNVKDKDKRRGYEERLEAVKKQIDEGRKIVSTTLYDKVNYSNFKWKVYKQYSEPLSKYYSDNVPYIVYAPEDVGDLNEVSLPLIVWLHGAGELGSKGGSTDSLPHTGLPNVINHWNEYKLEPIPAIVVAPHHILDSSHGWAQTRNIETIKALVSWTHNKYNIDTSKVVLVGHSYGGNGVFFVANAMKDTFSAVVALSPTLSKYQQYNFDKKYFSNIKIRSYSEFVENKAFFDWIEKPDSFIKVNVPHGEVPLHVFTKDEDNNGISDIIEWLFNEEVE